MVRQIRESVCRHNISFLYFHVGNFKLLSNIFHFFEHITMAVTDQFGIPNFETKKSMPFLIFVTYSTVKNLFILLCSKLHSSVFVQQFIKMFQCNQNLKLKKNWRLPSLKLFAVNSAAIDIYVNLFRFQLALYFLLYKIINTNIQVTLMLY